MIQLFSVVFCVVAAVLKFGFRLFIKETLNKRRPVEEGNAVTELGVLTGR
jgi:hypothetical protein